jgi:hypothetical protein
VSKLFPASSDSVAILDDQGIKLISYDNGGVVQIDPEADHVSRVLKEGDDLLYV